MDSSAGRLLGPMLPGRKPVHVSIGDVGKPHSCGPDVGQPASAHGDWPRIVGNMPWGGGLRPWALLWREREQPTGSRGSSLGVASAVFLGACRSSAGLVRPLVWRASALW